MDFEPRFSDAFGVPLPPEFARYLSEHPNGMENGYGPRLWNASAIQDETGDRELAVKGVCLIGTVDDVQHILLRARDGRVFMVDPVDHQIVDAWFSGIDSLIALLNLE